MATKRGQKRSDDVLGRRVWSPRELQDIAGVMSPEMVLAVLFFLGRLADWRARAFIGGAADECIKGNRG